MTLALTKITSNDAIRVLAEQLGCFADVRALQMAIAAEHIRGVLHSNVSRALDFDASPAVHTTRLLTGTRKSLELLWPRSVLAGPAGQGDSAQLALDALARVGDVVDTGGGFWIGAPLSLVANTEDASLCVLGAVPTPVVKSLSGIAASSVASARFALPSGKAQIEKCQPYKQSIDDWLGTEESLDTWTERLLAEHRARLTPSDDVPADQLQIYAPDVFAARGQNGRWFEARQLTQDISGLRLCRPLEAFGQKWNRPFYLAEFGFRSGQATLSRSIAVDPALTLRLRFGFDRRLHTPRKAVLVTGSDTFDLDLPYDLPAPEQRTLGMGWPSATRVDRLTFHRSARPVLGRAFERLGIIVDTRRGSHVQ
jgi:hypothetical protein